MAVETGRGIPVRRDDRRREVAPGPVRLRIGDGTATLSVKAATTGTCRGGCGHAVSPAHGQAAAARRLLRAAGGEGP